MKLPRHLLTIVLAAVLCAGCDQNVSGQSIVYSPSELCIGGVTYINYDRGITVKLNTSSTVVLCDMKAKQ